MILPSNVGPYLPYIESEKLHANSKKEKYTTSISPLYFIMSSGEPHQVEDSSRNPVAKFLKQYNFKLASASEEYINRRKRQMALFMTSAAVAILTSRFAYKSTITRQYVPTLFQGNHSPPLSFNFTSDAAVAVGTGTMLCGSVSSMMIFGTCWIMDVSSFKEFGWRMKSLMGGYEKQKELAKLPMDEESALIQDGLNDILEGKYDDYTEEEPKQ